MIARRRPVNAVRQTREAGIATAGPVRRAGAIVSGEDLASTHLSLVRPQNRSGSVNEPGR